METDLLDIVASELQEDILPPHLLIISLDYVLRTSIDLMKENGFTLARVRSSRYPAQAITDADYADDIALLANTPAPGTSCRWYKLPCERISKTIQIWRTRQVGQGWRSKDELTSNVLLWTPSHGQANVGRSARTCLQQLFTDTGWSLEDQPDAFDDRNEWQERVREIHASGTSWGW